MIAALFLLVLSTASCAPAGTPFSMLEEFQEYYAAYPAKDTVPTQEEQALLRKYRPRFHLAADAEPFIDFYRDYIASGTLRNGEDRLLSDQVSRELLNRHRDDPEVVFRHRHREMPSRQVAYGRVDYDTLRLPDDSEMRLTFLTYNIVFRKSGLAMGISWWKRALLWLVADLEDWHQLDHYISLTLVLTGFGEPLAVSLQQHNYQTTHILGRTMDLPGDNRLEVDVAISSNELYPHSPVRTVHRCASFLTPAAAHYLVTGEKKPALGGYDVTHGHRELEYELEFLAPSDAFYTFRGMLGEPRLIPHRDGPPGADFNTIPALKPKAVALVAFYRRGEGDLEYVELLERWRGDIHSELTDQVLERYIARFWEDAGKR